MRNEVSMAVRFVTDRLIMDRLPTNQKAKLTAHLTHLLYSKFSDHWHPRNPLVGNGFRVIRSCAKGMDEVLRQALANSGVRFEVASKILPKDFTVWCDPGDVSVRLGEDGSIWSLEFEPAPSSAPEAPRQYFDIEAAKAATGIPEISPMAITPVKQPAYRPPHATRENYLLNSPAKGYHGSPSKGRSHLNPASPARQTRANSSPMAITPVKMVQRGYEARNSPARRHAMAPLALNPEVSSPRRHA